MSKLNRRSFIKLFSQGTAALGVGMGSIKNALAAESANPAAKAAPGIKTTPSRYKYQTFTPGKYLDWEKGIIEPRIAEAAKGPQKSTGSGGAGPIAGGDVVGTTAVREYDILDFASKWNPENPLFNKTDYAKKAGYQGVPAYVCFKSPNGRGGGRLPKDITDRWYYANDGSDSEFFVPIYAGDTFTSETEKLIFEEVTVPESDLRHFIMGNTSAMYNQRGELVSRRTSTVRNAYRKILEGGPGPTFSENQEEWAKYLPEAHYTTDEEWDYIKTLWDKEKIRGSEKLYWEDVKIGDEPPLICTGPVSYMDMSAWHGPAGGNKKEMLKNAKTEYRDRFGNYLFNTCIHYGGRNIVGSRMVFYNNTAAMHLARMITNYIGDAGFVTKISWRIKQFYNEMQGSRFQGGEWFEKVPHMKGKECTHHGSEGDTIIGRGYVTDKRKDPKLGNIIDLTCWAETLDKRIITVVSASAKLPSKTGS